MTTRWKDIALQVREWFLENRGTPEGRKILLMTAMVPLLWGIGLFLHFSAIDLSARIPLQASRFAGLTEIAQAYRTIPLSQRQGGGSAQTTADPLTAASETVDRLKMKNRLKNLSSSNRGISLGLEGLDQNEMLALVRELKRIRLSVTAAEIRALPVDGKRKLSLSLLLGGQP
ncbi:MAG: hypothetical protein ACC613_11785 [Synergistales bacterium]|jgi:hypothetical protein